MNSTRPVVWSLALGLLAGGQESDLIPCRCRYQAQKEKNSQVELGVEPRSQEDLLSDQNPMCYRYTIQPSAERIYRKIYYKLSAKQNLIGYALSLSL